QLGLRAVPHVGDAHYPIAAAEAGDAACAQMARQVWQKGARADVQTSAAEHVGMVDQVQSRFAQLVARGRGRDGHGLVVGWATRRASRWRGGCGKKARVPVSRPSRQNTLAWLISSSAGLSRW